MAFVIMNSHSGKGGSFLEEDPRFRRSRRIAKWVKEIRHEGADTSNSCPRQRNEQAGFGCGGESCGYIALGRRPR